MYRASQVAQMVKNPLANAGDTRDSSSTPGSGRSPGRGNGNPLQNPSLENSMDRGAWQPTVHGIAKSWTWLSTHPHTCTRRFMQWFCWNLMNSKKLLLFSMCFRGRKLKEVVLQPVSRGTKVQTQVCANSKFKLFPLCSLYRQYLAGCGRDYQFCHLIQSPFLQ